MPLLAPLPTHTALPVKLLTARTRYQTNFFFPLFTSSLPLFSIRSETKQQQCTALPVPETASTVASVRREVSPRGGGERVWLCRVGHVACVCVVCVCVCVIACVTLRKSLSSNSHQIMTCSSVATARTRCPVYGVCGASEREGVERAVSLTTYIVHPSFFSPLLSLPGTHLALVQ